MSVLTTAGLIIKLFEPRWYNPGFDPFWREITNLDLSNKALGYTHKILADGGFDIANLSIADSYDRAFEIYSRGLGYTLLVLDQNGKEVWFGVINKITFSQGNITSSIGPLMEIVNDLVVVYTPLYVDIDPVEKGEKTFTAQLQNASSILKYGVHQAVYNAGEAAVTATYNAAEQLQVAYLNEVAFPSDDEQSIGFSATGSVSISFECVGLRYYLQKYWYNSVLLTGTTTISASGAASKLNLVLDADPNLVIAIRDFDSNSVVVGSLEDQYRLGSSIIGEMVSLGGVSPNFYRYTFGVYEDRTAKYKQIPLTAKYEFRQTESSQIYLYGTNQVVYPWDLRPANWLVSKNSFPGDPIVSPYVERNDPRVMFIEDVTYTAPYNFSVNGSRAGRLSQMIAQMGLSGVK